LGQVRLGLFDVFVVRVGEHAWWANLRG